MQEDKAVLSKIVEYAKKVKVIKRNNRHILFHTESLNIYEVDQQTARLVVRLQKEPVSNINGKFDGITQLYETYSKQITTSQPQTRQQLRLILHVSHKCNLMCSYCFANEYIGPKPIEQTFMTEKTAKNTVDLFFNLALNRKIFDIEINFSGGEPLLNFSVIKILTNYIKRKSNDLHLNVTLAISTNATLLDEEKATFLKRNGFTLEISIDGAEKDHNTCRKNHSGQGTYEEVTSSIRKYLCDYDRKIACAVVSSETKNAMLKNFIHLKSLGFSTIIMGLVTSENSKLSIKRNDTKDIISGLTEIIKYTINKNSDGSRLVYAQMYACLKCLFLKHTKTQPCDLGKNMFCVTPDGGIYPCYRLVQEQFRMGNVNDGNGLEKTKIFGTCSKVSDFTDCCSCWIRNICGGGDAECPADIYKRIGKFVSPHLKYKCKIMKTIVETTLIECTTLNDKTLKQLVLPNCNS